MIYAREDIDEGLHAVMFPVRKVDVYAETETGRQDRIPGKKGRDQHRFPESPFGRQ